MKKRILIFLPIYIPGVKGGGPIRSIEGIAYHLKDKFDIYIYTSDRDLGDKESYKNIEIDKWLNLEDCKVFYSHDRRSFKEIAKLVQELDFYKIYLNSFFSFQYSIKIMIMSKLRLINSKVILAPRGEFSSGALNLKSLKKKIYLFTSNMFKLYSNIEWHASTHLEKQDILKIYPNANIKVALNLSKPSYKIDKIKLKEENRVDLVFLSRISPSKNLKFALEVLKHVKAKVEYDIYGPIEDVHYWKECLNIINNLPPNITVNYKGQVPNNCVVSILSKYDFLFLPTLGENFGHVIKESLSAGTPIIISDQTPWKDLYEKKIGFDIVGFNIDSYVEVIEKIAKYNVEEYLNFSSNSNLYINSIVSDKCRINDMIKIFAK